MKVAKCNFNELIERFIEVSKDGYGIFCPDDKLLYANYAFLDIFCVANESPEFWSFEDAKSFSALDLLFVNPFSPDYASGGH